MPVRKDAAGEPERGRRRWTRSEGQSDVIAEIAEIAWRSAARRMERASQAFVGPPDPLDVAGRSRGDRGECLGIAWRRHSIVVH
jgi:hypothetical protein